MTQALKVTSRQKVLEIGTGSGYQTAVLAKLARRVYTIERHRELSREAERRFAELRLHNIPTKVGDGSIRWTEHAPFEHRLVPAEAPDMPPARYAPLAIGGMKVPRGGPARADRESVLMGKG